MKARAARVSITRSAVIVAAFLLAGGAASVLVSWSVELGWSLWLSMQTTVTGPVMHAAPLRVPGDSGSTLVGDHWRRFGQIHWFAHRPDLSEFVPGTPESPPPWLRIPRPGSADDTHSVGYGLPLVCMTLDITHDPIASPQPSDFHGAWTIGRIPAWSHVIALPIRPYVPGLLLNTLFYASLFTLPFTLKPLRRHLRSRRGHCRHCNYNLLHDFSHPCPECGRRAPSRESNPAPPLQPERLDRQ